MRLAPAITGCSTLIDQDPRNAETYNLRGKAHREKGAYDRAIADDSDRTRAEQGGHLPHRGLVDDAVRCQKIEQQPSNGLARNAP
jgi:hypothetical protein